jgi:hypothetical protein
MLLKFVMILYVQDLCSLSIMVQESNGTLPCCELQSYVLIYGTRNDAVKSAHYVVLDDRAEYIKH